MLKLRRFGQSSNFDLNGLLIAPIGCVIEKSQESAPIQRAHKIKILHSMTRYKNHDNRVK